jgi:hypothetical protein
VVVALPDSTQLRNDFKDRRGALRVVSVVSPTCEDCLAGLGLLFEAIDGAHVASLVLWLGMLPGDSPEAAEESAKRFAVDPPALHYWEEEGWPVSTRLRPFLGIGPHDPTRSAWDVSLLYGPGVEWCEGDPPAPDAWAYNTRGDLRGGERLSAARVRDWVRD